MQSGPFGCHTKLGAKRAEIVQKFVPRNRVGIFPNERTRSTPLDPKLTFCCIFHTIWVHSGPFGCLTKLGGKRAELVQKFVPRSCVRIFRNEHTQSTPFGPKLTFWCISCHFVASWTVWLSSETRCKTGRTSAKFVPPCCVRIFCNERTRSTPFGPKLTFPCISYHLGAFRTIWLSYETRCKTGRTSAKVCATKSRRNFLQRPHSIHSIGS